MDIRQSRREFKFRLPSAKAGEIIDEIKSLLPGDQNGTGGAYPIVSEYYDTLERDAFWERTRRFGNRRKLRVRVYGTAAGTIPPSGFLEVKHKCENSGVKRRISIPVDAVASPDYDVEAIIDDLMPRFQGRNERAFSNEILLLLRNTGVKPCMQMRYDRVAFEGPDDVRITFDSAIKCRAERLELLPDDPRFESEVIPGDECIMEVKLLETAPYWLRELTAKHGLVRTPFSKYCTALEKHDPTIKQLLAKAPASPNPSHAQPHPLDVTDL